MKGCLQGGKNSVWGKRRGKTLKMDSKKALYPLRYKAFSLAEKEGFEPSRPFRGLHDFQSCALDQLGDFSIIILLFFRAAISVCQNSNCYYTRAFLKVKPLFSRFSKKYCNSSKTGADSTWGYPDLRQVYCRFPHISARGKLGIAIPGSSCYLKSIIALRRLFRGILRSSAV